MSLKEDCKEFQCNYYFPTSRRCVICEFCVGRQTNDNPCVVGLEDGRSVKGGHTFGLSFKKAGIGVLVGDAKSDPYQLVCRGSWMRAPIASQFLPEVCYNVSVLGEPSGFGDKKKHFRVLCVCD